jgi:hypothetical protein
MQNTPGSTDDPATKVRNRLGLAILLGLGCLWLAAISLGTNSLMAVERRPGRETCVPGVWPRESSLLPFPEGATSVLIAHPKCPCTRASLDQLAQIVNRSPRPLRGYVLFIRPSEVSSSWARTPLWDRATEIPGFVPLEDVDGREAHRFGAATSGHFLVYDSGRTLRFSGGITSARGSQGENAGMSSALAYLTNGSCPHSRTPVFGCPIDDAPTKR